MRVALIILLALSGCARAPVTGRRTLTLVPASQMNQLGAEAYQEALSQTPRSDRSDWNEMVRRVGSRIAAVSGAEFDWEFNVLDAPDQVNAFALPGGKVAIYTGILPVLQNEAALAAVIGHEVAHVTAQHSAERISQTMLVQLGLAAADLSLKDGKQRGMLMGLLGLGAQVGVLLPFSRLEESEADEIGLHYMAEAGYDPREASELWKRMGAAGGAAPPELLSTHPASETRVLDLASQVSDVSTLYEQSDKQESRPIAH